MTQTFLGPTNLLKLSPKAPPLAFKVDAQNGMQFANAANTLQQLRFQPEGSKTLFPVRRNAEGQFYYDQAWKPFAEFLEASTKQQPKKMAAIEPLAQAPEIGFTFPFAFLAILGQHPVWHQSNVDVQQEGPVLAYLQGVLEKGGASLLQAMECDSTLGTISLLDAALIGRRFAVAELLWEAGVRPHPESLKQANPLWALVAQTQPPYTPSWEVSFEHRASAYLAHSFKAVGRDVDDLDDYHLQLNLVWLNRFESLDLNPQAVRRFSNPGDGALATDFTAFEAALRMTVGSLWQSPREQAWLETMKALGYDFNKPVNDPFLGVAAGGPEALSEWARKLNHPDTFLVQLRELGLKTTLEDAISPGPKLRF